MIPILSSKSAKTLRDSLIETLANGLNPHIEPDAEISSDNNPYSEAKNSLLGFTQHTNPIYKADPFHVLIASTLDRVVAGELKRVMIFAPPQHGKSELVSVRLPAYWAGERPEDPVILTSYGADLAHNKSREARDIVESEAFAQLYPDIQTKRTSRSTKRWRLDKHRFSLLAAGAGGPITGNGGMLGIIDDPFQNWEQAQSPRWRQRVWDWYRGTFRTRIWEGGAIVLIMTRWHEDDLAGRILALDHDEWEVLRIPAIAETQQQRDENNEYLNLPLHEPDPLHREAGEPVAPSLYSIEALRSIEKDLGAQIFAAEYQGVPRAPEGNRFKRGWFERVVDFDDLPYHKDFFVRLVRYWDKAGTEGGDGAATASVLMGLGKDQRNYILDAVQGWWSAYAREEEILKKAKEDYGRFEGRVKTYVEQEPGSGGKESAESTIKNLAGYSVYADPVTGDKDTRMEPFAAYTEAGNLTLVKGRWNGPYIEEMISIPGGKRRDWGDASSGAHNKLHLIGPAAQRLQHSGLYPGRNKKQMGRG